MSDAPDSQVQPVPKPRAERTTGFQVETHSGYLVVTWPRVQKGSIAIPYEVPVHAISADVLFNGDFAKEPGSRVIGAVLLGAESGQAGETVVLGVDGTGIAPTEPAAYHLKRPLPIRMFPRVLVAGATITVELNIRTMHESLAPKAAE